MIKINAEWKEALKDALDASSFKAVDRYVQKEREAGKTVYPEDKDVFNALNETPLHKVKVVILGQDPYHGPDQAHGLSFSVRRGIRLPPSLKNIYKELELEYKKPMPKSGDLTGWAKQGVLLLNATLTVEEGKAGAHQKKGWEEFTDAVIAAVDRLQHPAVFMLWGSHAQKKGAVIDREKHLVLEAPHPSPLSAHRGFFGCNHFRLANDYLAKHGQKIIDWYNL